MSAESVWFSNTLWARGLRTVLAPAAWLFRGVVRARNAMYDRGLARVTPSAVPVVSVGNLSVGGTGKTPFAAWLVAQLVARGARPAIVMRGYGDDEPLVHRLLSPNVPVYTGPDRVASIARASQEGCDVVVLDDGFQHRHAARSADIVLVSADAWPLSGVPRVLPAGPFREPLRGLRRASLAIVTSKAASPEAVDRVRQAIHRVTPSLPTATVLFALRELVEARALDAAAPARLPVTALSGASVLAIAGIGEPEPFFQQLRALGATVTARPFPDHHPFSDDEIAALATAAGNHKYVISTLKDAVKLGPRWPAKAPPLWYVSQAVEVNDGQSFIETLILDILSQRRL